jgi:pimeloyl-ACP methyl ester carboxylesterase
MTDPFEALVPVDDGVALYVRLWPGAGQRPFVLVHGLASNARMWDGVARRLAALGHPVVAVDQRGHGRSDKPEYGYDFTSVTDDLAALIRSLGWEQPVVAGQSWGGNVVLELAYRFPELTAGICCVDGGTIELAEHFGRWEDCERALTPPPLAGTPLERVEAAVRAAHPCWPESGIQGMLANFEVLDDGTVRPWLTLERHLAILRALWEHHPTSRFSQVRVPALLVMADTGEVSWTADKRHGVERAERLLPTCRVQWFRPADHDVHAQHPLEVADLLHRCCTDGFFDTRGQG